MLAVFRDDMRTVVRLAGPEFLQRYGIPGGLRIDGEQELNVAEFRVSGQAVAARLDLLGVTEEDVTGAESPCSAPVTNGFMLQRQGAKSSILHACGQQTPASWDGLARSAGACTSGQVGWFDFRPTG
jgi:hypothetical protein